jgi:hypothetical protein
MAGVAVVGDRGYGAGQVDSEGKGAWMRTVEGVGRGRGFAAEVRRIAEPI